MWQLKTIAAVVSIVWIVAALSAAQNPARPDDPDARPPVTKADLRVVERAQQILNSSSKWNRADTRRCPADAKTFSIYCALETATKEESGTFEHRGAAMQEARFLIEDITRHRDYQHRLMDYNNDPTTTFGDVQRFFALLRKRIDDRLNRESSPK
jgi:hypothetical protein